jgi:DNA-binding PadR family transcriptional regulator
VPKIVCPRHAGAGPCGCALGNLYRYIEPSILLILKEEKRSYGYDLSEKLAGLALTDATIERAALYRTLRLLEENGYVISGWDVEGTGPARRVYTLTEQGRQRLREWTQVLRRTGQAMIAFSRRAGDISTPRRRKASSNSAGKQVSRR